MIGPILLAVSWILLRLEGKSLDSIGVDQPRRRLTEFLAGFALLGLASAAQQLALSAATGDSFTVNQNFRGGMLLEHARFVVNSVLFEELLFRGYVLYQLCRFLGPRRAIWIDAAAFGIYHWFSYSAFGNPVVMIYVLVMTGMMGLMWARAFTATKSVAAPIGLHFGWNAIAYIVFSTGPLGAALLVPSSGVAKLKASGLASVAISVVWPLIITVIVMALCGWYERRTAEKGAPV